MKTRPEIRGPFDTVRSITTFHGESRVQAEGGNDTDINRIMERFMRTGVLPGEQSEPQYADVTPLQQDLQDILNRGKEAAKELEELQAEAERRQEQQTQTQQPNDDQAQPADPPPSDS